MDKQRNFKLTGVICLLGLLLASGCGKETHKAERHKKDSKHKAAHAKREPAVKVKGTEIGGEISKNTTLSLAESPYYVSRDLIVLPDVKLTIEPGVEIKVATYTAIIVKGNFHAIGTKQKKIKFTCADKNDTWDGIQFTDESFDYNSDDLIEGHGCIVEYCLIEKAKTGIICEKSSPVIRHNVLDKNEEGIKCRSWSNPLIAYNSITNNTIGISCEEYSSPDIHHNTIIGLEGHGIKCAVYSSPKITYNTIFGQGETWWKGITCQDSSAPKINFNNIYSNGGFNFFYVKLKPGEGSPDIDARNNWWGLNDKEAIANTILDKQNKAELGEVHFVPFATSKIKNAGHLG